MKTELDSGGASLIHLESLEYDCSKQAVSAVVIEGFQSDAPETLVIGEKRLGPVYSVNPNSKSRRFRVDFPRPVAWQCVDESFAAKSDAEEHDGEGYLYRLTKSPYRDYVLENHGWHEQLVGPSVHYRLWTADEVLDVVSLEPPTIRQL